MKENKLSKSVKATMEVFEERVRNLNSEDKLAGLTAYLDKQVEVPLAYILIEDNVRRELDTNSIKFQELVASIRTQGLLQNLVVELRQEEGQYQLYCIAGQRRLLAAQEVGIVKANCLIKQFENKAQRIAAGLTENLTREDLSCLDIAEGYAGLIANGWREEEIANHFERNPRTIRRYLSIAAWPQGILSLIRQHQHIFTTKVIFNQFVARRFNTEEEFRQALLAKISGAREQPGQVETNADLKQLEHDLRARLQMKITVTGGATEGKLTISYTDAAQLHKIRQLLLAEE